MHKLLLQWLLRVLTFALAVIVTRIVVIGGAARDVFSRRSRIVTMVPAFTALLVAVAVLVSACATVKHVARTINDAADIACELFAADHPDALQSLTPEQWCDIHEHLDPFIEEILQAQREAGAKLGIQSPSPIGPEE